MKNWISLLFLLLVFGARAHNHHTFIPVENHRSDSIDITKYKVRLHWNGTQIIGECELSFKAKVNGINSIRLDLLRLITDSVKSSTGAPLNFTRTDSVVTVSLPTINVGDSTKIKLYYKGIPFHENWGGWHNRSGYVFNLGVGFQSIPHNLGKAWHPCFDNFVERAQYEVTIVNDSNLIGVGSGDLVQEKLVGATRESTWRLGQEIPTYLYGIAIADYSVHRDTIQGIYSKTPVSLYCKSRDVSSVKSAFRNLDSMFLAYETRFGKYRWSRVGYAMTGLGAMEHATNIAYPINAISDESTIAHELSHHWWGDLITCQTDRDMWINEGMAVFAEYIFQEYKYGMAAMNASKEENLFEVVRYAHLEENGYQPISGVPRVHTYGKHSYRKGSLVAHNMRKYLGDSLFFTGAKAFLDSFQFKAVNSYDFKDFMSSKTGVNMDSFFEQWVFGAGMPDYQLLGFKSVATTGLYENEVEVFQNIQGAKSLFTNMPVTIRYYDKNGSSWEETVRLSKQLEIIKSKSPIQAVYVEVNPNYELSYAMTMARDTLSSPRQINSKYIGMTIGAKSINGTVRLKSECHWAKPYISVQNRVKLGVRVNPNRYWSFSSIDQLNGRFTLGGPYESGAGQIDSGLVQIAEDSLVLLYKPMGKEWQFYDTAAYRFIHAAPGDKRGVLLIDSLALGDFVLAEKDPAVNDSLLDVSSDLFQENNIQVYPNPAKEMVNFDFRNRRFSELTILDAKGNEVQEFDLTSNINKFRVSTDGWKSGVYFYILTGASGLESGRFIIKN